MTKRTIAARARYHIHQGYDLLDAHTTQTTREGWDYKDSASALAYWILRSANGDPKAKALLMKAGVEPDCPRATRRAIDALLRRRAV
jgi:hypothetical protein